MTHYRPAFVAVTAGILLFTGPPFARAHGPGFAGSAPAHAGVQGPSAGNHQAFSPQSMHYPTGLVLGRPYIGVKPGYRQSFVLKHKSTPLGWGRRSATTYNITGGKSSTGGKNNIGHPRSELTVPPPPPAAAPASMAMSSPRYALTSSSASYCATPQGNCHLAERQIIGDRCWCVGPAGERINGTVR
jgi:hypothetical protein